MKHVTGTFIALAICGTVILLSLLPPRLYLAKWREERYAPCTFGRILRFLVFAGVFSLGAAGWRLVLSTRACEWCEKTLTPEMVGCFVAALGAACYLATYGYQLWILDAVEAERRHLKKAVMQ